MSAILRGRLAAARTLACACLPVLISQSVVERALAQSGSPAASPDIVVTPFRSPQAVSRAGSAISVISREEIEKASAKDIGDLLRRVPGITLTQTGGPGASQTVRIRGMDSRHTLVLIDGIRVNDPTTPTGEFDFAALVPANIERIEVLRGPQSALYGSDAVGGVINVITRKGGRPQASIQMEGGSYGTKAASGGFSGGSDRFWYSFGATAYDTAGFSRYGERIGRIQSRFGWPLENDAAGRYGVQGRIGAKVTDTITLEAGGGAALNDIQYDAGFLPYPDTPAQQQTRLFNGYTRLTGSLFDGALTNTLTAFANRTDRQLRSISYFGPATNPTTSWSRFGYRGDREGGEYQGDLKLGSFGLLTFGAKVERERFLGDSENVLPVPRARRIDDKADQTTRSVFALHQISFFNRLHLSLGGRIDDVIDVDTFPTWRATLAYEVPETETKFRTSVGTAAKAPSLFQLYSDFGTPGLQSETSVGVDAGIDQSLADGRVALSGTVFVNRYRNFIDFVRDPRCTPLQAFGCYVNVARAQTAGFELEAKATLIDELLALRLAYTHLRATDVVTDKTLGRRPENEARLGFIITPLRGLSIEPTLTLVDYQYTGTNETLKVQPYARLDVYADYKVTEALSLFMRAENLTDARYEEVRDYATAGRSFYGGIRATW